MLRHSCCSWREQPPSTICDFYKLAFSPALSLKTWRVFIRICSEGASAFQNNIKSFANMRWVRSRDLLYGWNLKSACWHTVFSNLKRYSIAMTNNRGESGSLYLSPFPPSNFPLSSPYRCMENLTEVTQAMIHFMNMVGNFNADRTSYRNP